MGTQEVATASVADLAIGDTLLDILSGKLKPPPIDTVELNARITRAMLAATSPEEALAAGATSSFEDGLLGVPIEVRNIAFRESTLAGESPVFLLIDGYNLRDGIEVTLTCSAQQVMRTLAVWKAKGWLPATFVVEKADTKTSEGFTPYTIKAV